jgi:putative spermidine/putrescine transport system permease protein
MLPLSLPFDEVIVTTFRAGQQSTLPIRILDHLARPRERPLAEVIALLVFAATAVPILLAHRLSSRQDEPQD